MLSAALRQRRAAQVRPKSVLRQIERTCLQIDGWADRTFTIFCQIIRVWLINSQVQDKEQRNTNCQTESAEVGRPLHHRYPPVYPSRESRVNELKSDDLRPKW